MAHRTLAELTDAELEEQAEAIAREQEDRRIAGLRAIRYQSPMFLPNRLYTSAAR